MPRAVLVVAATCAVTLLAMWLNFLANHYGSGEHEGFSIFAAQMLVGAPVFFVAGAASVRWLMPRGLRLLSAITLFNPLYWGTVALAAVGQGKSNEVFGWTLAAVGVLAPPLVLALFDQMNRYHAGPERAPHISRRG